jgi:hypothetical protein
VWTSIHTVFRLDYEPIYIGIDWLALKY